MERALSIHLLIVIEKHKGEEVKHAVEEEEDTQLTAYYF